ncbi:MAG: hypothetical protein CM1200mP10_25890 [Candidatus Neomarinimicrobiota bacterium]|nr:MAG: hypothetical protein CM1200mP10_25890 [Candidatus Neomarinimicrobiota bacterium]
MVKQTRPVNLCLVSMGYEIKGGKLGNAIKDTTISGVAFEVLKTIDMISSDMTWSAGGMCGKKQWIPVGMGGPPLNAKSILGVASTFARLRNSRLLY